MVKRKKYLWEHPPGRWRIRRRVNGKVVYVPLKEGGVWLQPNTPEFDALYWKILTGKHTAPQRSMAALIEHYRASDRWQHLSPRTKADYDRVLTYLRDKVGNRHVSALQRVDIVAAQDANRERVRFANYITQVLSVLFEHAKDIGWRNDNPAKGVRKIGKAEGHKAWPEHIVAAYVAACEDPRERLAIELGIGTGQRAGDLVRMRWTDYDGEGITVQQGKTGTELWIPATARLSGFLAGYKPQGITMLTSRHGKPLTYSGLAQMVRRVCERARIEGYTIHGWRYTAAAQLAEAGCSDAEIAAITGHKSMQMVGKYRRGAAQKRMAKEAQERRQ